MPLNSFQIQTKDTFDILTIIGKFERQARLDQTSQQIAQSASQRAVPADVKRARERERWAGGESEKDAGSTNFHTKSEAVGKKKLA